MIMATAQLEIISREIIKPSSPTPPHLRTFNLSYFDQIAPSMYVPVILFYNPSSTTTTIEKSNLLKKSLSETLAEYYPFAGRIKNGECIDCNDEGVVFLEVKIKEKLSEFLSNPKVELVDLLFTDSLGWTWTDSNLSTLVAVQITLFECGGMAISVCMLHKVGDAATMVTFINDWAAKASNSGKQVSPLFNLAEIFPKGDLQLIPQRVTSKEKYASRRFVFDASKIAALKVMVAHKVQNPTRVEVVSALIYKCAISASKASLGTGRPTILQNMINIRSRLIPPFLENFAGNIAWFTQVPRMEDGEIELQSLVGQMKEALVQFSNTYAKKFRGEEWFLSIRENVEESKELFQRTSYPILYTFSSWCRFPIYQADFGFGKPVWASIGSSVDKNVIILLDTKSGDGIEALVTLEEQDMAMFEHDEELLAFATSNPSPLCSDDQFYSSK